MQGLGALPYKGLVTDTKVCIQAILPDVFEAIPGEVIAFVMSLENSDFGNGALSFASVLSASGATTWRSSLRTCGRYTLVGVSTRTSCSHSVRMNSTPGRLCPLWATSSTRNSTARASKRMELLAVNAAKTVDPQQAMRMLRDALGVGEAQKVIDAYKSADIEMIPAGNNAWRLSNAISWLAGRSRTPRKNSN